MKASIVHGITSLLLCFFAGQTLAGQIDFSLNREALKSPTWSLDFAKEQEIERIPEVTFTNSAKIQMEQTKDSRWEVVPYSPSGEKGKPFWVERLRIILAYPNTEKASIALLEKRCAGSACNASSYLIYYVQNGELKSIHLDRAESTPSGIPFNVDWLRVFISDNDVKSLCVEGLVDGEDTDEMGDLVGATKCVSPQNRLLDVGVRKEFEVYANTDLTNLLNDNKLKEPFTKALGDPAFEQLKNEFLSGKLTLSDAFVGGRFIIKLATSSQNSTKLFLVMDATNGDFFFLGINDKTDKQLFLSNIVEREWTSNGFYTWSEALSQMMSEKNKIYSIKFDGSKFVVSKEVR